MAEVMNREKNILREAVAAYNVNEITRSDLYHNTVRLLKLYKQVRSRINQEIIQLNDVCIELVNKNVDEVINNTIDFDPRIDNERLRLRLESIAYSKGIIDFINQALTMLKKYSENGEMYYVLIYMCYIDESIKPIEDYIDDLNISRSTLFREKKRAIEELSIVLWGYFYK